MITPSRRTPDELVAGLRKLAERHPGRVRLHDGSGANPYLGYLAHADAVMVTEDSSNMLVEACATEVPVLRLPMAGSPGKLGTLYSALRERRGVEVWDGKLPSGRREPLLETRRVAAVVVERLNLSRTG